MIGASFVTSVRLAGAPVVNGISNPNAEVDLSATAGAQVTIARATGLSHNDRATAFRIQPTGAAASFFWNEGDGGTFRLGMQPGKTYTARASIRIPATLSGTPDARARRIVAVVRNANGTYTDHYSNQAPNAAGSYELAVTFSIPADATEAFVRFFHGHPSGATYVDYNRLRVSEGTETDPFDGNSGIVSPTDDVRETGWLGAVGSSRSWRRPLGGDEIAGAGMTLTLDRFRVPWVTAEISAPYPGDAIWSRLDPRSSTDVVLYWSAERRNLDGSLDYRLPPGYAQNGRGKLWVREISHDPIAGTIRISATSGESKLEDKKRMAGDTRDTGATTAIALWEFAIADAGEGASIPVAINDGAATAAIPAGDRRLWQPGESLSALFEAELAGLVYPCRNYCDLFGRFEIRAIENPPHEMLAFLDLTTGDAGTVVRISKRISREDGWADSTLVKGTYRTAAGATTTAYANDTAGANTAGQVVSIDRPIPTYLAASYTREAQRKGMTVEVEALADFRATPGRSVRVYDAAGALLVRLDDVDVVRYDLTPGSDSYGRMTITGKGR